MKFLKNNLKLILACIITAILTGGIVYAATSASEVTYTTNKNGEVQTVADALNDLYNIKNSTIIKETRSVTGGSLSYSFENDYKAVCILISDNDSRGSTWSTTCENSELLYEGTSPSDLFTYRYILLENVKKGNTISASHTENKWGITFKMIFIK